MVGEGMDKCTVRKNEGTKRRGKGEKEMGRETEKQWEGVFAQ